MVGKMQGMWVTAAPYAPMPPAPDALPVPVEVTWHTTLQCRASRTCSSSTAVLSQGPQLSPGRCPRPQCLGMPAFMKEAMCSAKAVHLSTCTVVCLETLISGHLIMNSKRVLYQEPGPSLTTSFSTYRPPAHILQRALLPLHSPRLEQTHTPLNNVCNYHARTYLRNYRHTIKLCASKFVAAIKGRPTNGWDGQMSK